MLRGTADFVDPDELIGFYRANGNICMPLDLPLPTAAEPKFFDAVTRMMKANDEYMLPKLHDKQVLALISQGSNVSNRLRRLEGLKRTSSVVAIAGLNTLSADDKRTKNMISLSNALAVISSTRDTTSYYHFLGVTSTFWFIVYSILVGTGYVKRAGGDSVSHRMLAINGTYKYGLGAKSTGLDDLSRNQKTPLGTTCRCPVCRLIPDQRALLDSRLAEGHSLFNAIEIKNLIADSVELYLAGRVTLKEIAEQWKPTGGYSALAKAVDYINLVIQKGYVEWKPSKSSGLFTKVESVFSDKGNDHFKTIINRYEKFHGKTFLKA